MEQSQKEKSNKNICPVCGLPYDYVLSITQVDGKQYCKHDSPEIGAKSEIAKKRNANDEYSAIALKQAMEHRKLDADMGVGKMIPVRSNQPGSAGKTESIPEQVIKSIEEKVAPELLEE